MKQALQIEAVVDEPQLLEQLVRRLVNPKYASGAILPLPAYFKAVGVASAETFVSGTVMLDDAAAHLAIPFITPFLFSCLKNRNGQVTVEWCASLS